VPPRSDGRLDPAIVSVALAVAGAIAIVVAWRAGDVGIDLPWAPAWGLRLHFELDGLAVLYSLLATGVGAAVFTFASGYLPAHLAHEGRPPRDAWRFHALLVLFMGAMVGLACAQDLILLFVFWDVTAITSYLLIAFDRDRLEARLAALMALLVTGITALALLVAALVLHQAFGTFSIPEILARTRELGGSHEVTVAAVLIAIAGLAKSAQVPLHAWLPRAMAAPTPVSAYLHSAAMVAAGVLLISRLHPLLATSDLVMTGLIVVGGLSMVLGGLLALGADELKQILANSTISQYGYVVLMLGMGGPKAAAAACFYVGVHALCKSALFMTAGAVTAATGATALSATGGLGRSMRVVAVGSGLAAAGVAALPLTAGFFKDELLFGAALGHSTATSVLAVAGAVLTFAYIGRFWLGLFTGPRRGEAPAPVPLRMTVPVVVLGALVVALGIAVGPLAELAEDAGAVVFGAPAPIEPALHLDLRGENLMALAVWALGAAVLAAGRVGFVVPRVTAAVHAAGRAFGPRVAYDSGLRALNALSDAIHDFEVRDLRARVAAVLVPSAAFTVAGLLVTPWDGTYRAGDLLTADIPLAVVLLTAVIAAFATTQPRGHRTLVLVLSGNGFALAAVYALLGAPNVALVAVLVETVFALLFLGVFALLPPEVLAREARLPDVRSRRIRDPLVGVGAGIVAFLVMLGALSRPTPESGAAAEAIARTPEAHGRNVVTVILTDFRGLDTVVEITVVLVAMVALLTLLRRGRLT
jgi:multicomponent Na+:H+ antiporter subunit A